MQRREPTLDGASTNLETLDSLPTRIGGQRPRADYTPASEPEVARSGGSSALGIFALILALAGLGAAGFLYQQWQVSRAALASAEGRILELEKRFEMSGEESAASVEVLNAKVKENAAEIRKLWGVSYDTNRKNIATNESGIAANKKQIAALAGKVSGLDASVAKIAAVEKAVAELRSANTQKDREVTDKLASLERQLASVRSDLSGRVAANEEAVQSIDAYRRSVNKDLVQLRDAIRSLQSGSTASVP